LRKAFHQCIAHFTSFAARFYGDVNDKLSSYSLFKSRSTIPFFPLGTPAVGVIVLLVAFDITFTAQGDIRSLHLDQFGFHEGSYYRTMRRCIGFNLANHAP
jgi:hypothetical protein